MFCLYCRADIPEDALFCNKCGRRQNAATDTSSAEEDNPGYEPTMAVTPPSPHTSYDSEAQPPYSLQSTVSVGASSPVLTQLQNRRGLWITLGIVAAVLLVGGIIIANLPSPSKTLDNFCNALMNGDAQGAYNQLSPGFQSKTSEGSIAFALSFNKVTSCTHDTPGVSGSTATANLTIVYASGQTQGNEISLVQDSSGAWKIDNIVSNPGS